MTNQSSVMEFYSGKQRGNGGACWTRSYRLALNLHRCRSGMHQQPFSELNKNIVVASGKLPFDWITAYSILGIRSERLSCGETETPLDKEQSLDMRIVVLTGAGISAESGLSTFRDKDGIWAKYDLSAVATPQGFQENPSSVLEFYNMRRAVVSKAEPNDAHFALARLQRHYVGEVALITQNTDDLHEKAGSPFVIHVHGEITDALCANCGDVWTAPAVMSASDPCPNCQSKSTRPNVVWFGEIPYHLDKVEEFLSDADLFVSIGTSGQVYPAAGFAAEAARNGAATLELNLEASANSRIFDNCIFGPATKIVPAWVNELLAQ